MEKVHENSRFFSVFFEQLRTTSPNYHELAISMNIPEVFMENVRTGLTVN
jgi:hypothetical protein